MCGEGKYATRWMHIRNGTIKDLFCSDLFCLSFLGSDVFLLFFFFFWYKGMIPNLSVVYGILFTVSS